MEPSIIQAETPIIMPATPPPGDIIAVGTQGGVALANSLVAPGLSLVAMVKTQWQLAADYRRDDELAWQKVHENYRGNPPRPANEVAMGIRSRVTMKVTRVKVAAAVAREREIGFKWNLEPTRMPLLWEHSEDEIRRYVAENISSMQEKALAAILEQEIKVEDLIEEERKIALDRADRMKIQIKDDLQECRFDASYDQGILEHCLLGTMIFKGPFTKKNQPGRFMRHGGGWHWVDTDGLTTYRPEASNISCWDFYPSPGAFCVENLEYAIDRQVTTRAGITDLIDQDGYNTSEILAALRDQSGKWTPEPWELGLMASNKQQDPTGVVDRFTVLDWWGYIRVGDLRTMGGRVDKVKRFDVKSLKMVDKDLDDEDVVIANIVVCGDHVFKAIAADMKPKRLPFYVVPYEKVPKRLFGQGVAWMMEDWQAVLNTVYRAMLDNMAISALPLGWYDKKRVKAQSDVLTCGKMFASEGNENYTLPPVQFFDVPSKIPMLKQIADISKANIEESTSMPDMINAMTGPGGHNRTSSGLSILGGWADASARSVQRNVDAEFTKPFITAMYFWEMQLSPNDSIKGDFQIEAKGVESVIADELLTQRINEAMQMLNQDPEADIQVDKGRVYTHLFDKLGFKDAGFIRSKAEQKQRRDEKLQEKQQQIDMEAQAAAKYQPRMTPEDAALKFFSEIPDEALVYKLETARKVGAILGITDRNMDAALNQSLQIAQGNAQAGNGEGAKLAAQMQSARLASHTALQGKAMDNATKIAIAKMKPAPAGPSRGGGGASKKAEAAPAGGDGAAFNPTAAKGDTIKRARINPTEDMVLRAMGGAGVKNPRTGETHYYDTDGEGGSVDGGGDSEGSGGPTGGGDPEGAQNARDHAMNAMGEAAGASTRGTFGGPSLESGGKSWKGPSDVRASMAAFGQNYMGDTYNGTPGIEGGYGWDPKAVNDPNAWGSPSGFNFSQPGSYQMNPHGFFSRLGHSITGLYSAAQVPAALSAGLPGFGAAWASGKRAHNDLSYALKDADYSVSGQTPTSGNISDSWGGPEARASLGNPSGEAASPEGGRDWPQMAYGPGGALSGSTLANLTPSERRLVMMNLMRRYRHA